MTSSGHSLGTTRTSDRRVSISPTPSHWGLPSPPPPHWPEQSLCPQTSCSGRFIPLLCHLTCLSLPLLKRGFNSLDLIYGPFSHFIFLQCNVLTGVFPELTPFLPWWSIQNPMVQSLTLICLLLLYPIPRGLMPSSSVPRYEPLQCFLQILTTDVCQPACWSICIHHKTKLLNLILCQKALLSAGLTMAGRAHL